MAENCECAGTKVNTGIGKCPKTIKRTTFGYLTPVVANDGTVNKIDLATATKVDLSALANHVDPSKRIYPIQGLKGVTIVKTDSTYNDLGANERELTTEGIYQFEGMIAGGGVPAGLLLGLEGISCGRWAYYGGTVEKSVYGEKIGDELYPIELKAFDVNYTFATLESLSNIPLKFDLDDEFNAGRLWQLERSDLLVDPTKVEGVKNANMVATAPTATSVDIAINSDFGSGFTANQNVLGLELADFTMVDSAGLSIAITTVTEGVDKYSFTFPSQSAGDYTISTVIATSGYEGSVTFTI